MKRLRIINANIFTPTGSEAVRGKAMGKLHHITDGVIDAYDGIITYCGPSEEAPAIDTDESDVEIIDAAGRAVLPGFVDSHTHLVFGGYRPEEFSWRMRGDTYMSIMERGGGIVSTMKATREASEEELIDKARHYLDVMSAMGVTTVEGKSGYGLDLDCELKQLEVMAKLDAEPDRKVDIYSTFLGAHAVPPEYAGRSGEYIDYIINTVLPEVQKRCLAESCDVFCEKGVFTIEESRRLLETAKKMGFAVKIHADEIVDTGSASLAAELKALSADHLLHANQKGIVEMARNGVVATLLPLTAFTLRENFAPGRKMIDEGCAVALATDLNPGSCCSGSIPLTFALACIYMGFSVEEAVTAMTLNGASAIGRADTIGSLEEGKLADIVILDSDTPLMLPYYTGMNSVRTTIKRGRVVSGNP